MSEHSFPISFESEHLPNDNFISWLRNNTALFLGQIAALLSIVLYIATFIYYVLGHDTSTHKTSPEEYLQETKKILFILNIIFCFLFVIFSIYILNKNETGEYHAKLFYKRLFNLDANLDAEQELKKSFTSLKSFKLNFLCYWCYAITFYVVSLLIPEEHEELPTWINVDIFKCLLNSLLMILVYWQFSVIILSNRSKYFPKKSNQNKKPFFLSSKAPVLIYLFFWSIYFSVFGLVFKVDVEDKLIIAMALSGVLNMVALSLLISRLDSKLIGLPPWLLSILYGYAAIQPLDILLGGNDLLSKMISVSIYLITFIFKIYFFLILTYLMQTGRMLSYFYINSEMSNRLRGSRSYTNQ